MISVPESATVAAMNDMLTQEIELLRLQVSDFKLREQVAKKAFDKKDAEIAALREDKARLDWLLSTDTKHIGVHADGHIMNRLINHPGVMASYLSDTEGVWLLDRAAIDAARKQGGES